MNDNERRHVVFVAPFFLDTTLRFLAGALELPGAAVSLVSQDPASRLPPQLRERLAGHRGIADGLDAQQILDAARALARRVGPAQRVFGPLEQLQVPLAEVREALGLPGLPVDAARNFRDKSRMKTVLRAAGVPCARHRLAGSADEARAFADETGFPLVVKPPAGAGGLGTFRLDRREALDEFLHRHAPRPQAPLLVEEFVTGTEHSFDSVFVDGELVWHSVSRYLPSPLEVLENPWIQWCVLLPRAIDGAEYDPIREAAVAGLQALGMGTGLSHMEWFRRHDGSIAISEVGARPPGAQITSLLSYAHELDFYRAWPRLMVLGEFSPPPRRYAAGAAYFRGQGAGRVQAIHGLDEAQRRYGELVVEVKLPQEGRPPSSSYEGDGYVILRHPETAVVADALAGIVQLVRVELA